MRELVYRVALLATKAHQFMKGKHTKKTASFVKACLAYCHITIPSLDDLFSKLYLFLQCAEVALVNQMVVQAEALVKSAVALIPEVPHIVEENNVKRFTDDELANYLRNFASFLLLFPGHPKNGPFYLVQGLLNAVNVYEPWKGVSVHKTQVYLGVLTLFCAYFQRSFPYHIDRVESNDVLYGNDAQYNSQIKSFIDTLLTDVLQSLQAIGEKTDIVSRKQRGTLALDTVNFLIGNMTMNASTATLVVKLYQMAVKTEAVDAAYLANTLSHLQTRKGTWYSEIANKI